VEKLKDVEALRAAGVAQAVVSGLKKERGRPGTSEQTGKSVQLI
jgi:hypothetical protein